jgi:5-formyltetrahydrofolate cyclo-ligase
MVNKSILNIVSALNSSKTIGLFYPYKNEVDVILMALELKNIGLTCLLPKVINEHSPLKYFFYSPNNPNLEKGYGGIMEPTGNEAIDPDIIITSCSAFNEKGYRVGYGGGFFDRTLSQLKQKKKIISILAAFENQKTAYQFQDSFDEKVDYICTENKTYRT